MRKLPFLLLTAAAALPANPALAMCPVWDDGSCSPWCCNSPVLLDLGEP